MDGQGKPLAVALIQIRVDVARMRRELHASRKQFSETIKTISGLGRGASRSLGALTQPIATATRAVRALGLATKTSLAPVLAMGGVAGGVLGAGMAVKKWADFEQEMARVKAITGATGPEFEKLSALAMKLGAETQFTAAQAGEAMGNLAVAGFSTGEIMAAMRPSLDLAAAGQMDVATAADITAKTMRGMGLSAEETRRAMDVMAKAFTTSNTDLVQLGDAFRYVGPVGKAAGKQIEELTAAIQIMSDAGIQGESAGAALRNILLRLQSQPSEVRKGLEELGVSIADTTGRMLPLADIVDQLNTSMASLTDVERSAIASRIAGTRASAAFLELLDSGGEKLRTFEKRLAGSAGAAARIAAVQMDTLKGSLVILSSAVEGAAIEFGRALAPAVAMAAKAAAGLAPALGEALAAAQPISDLIGQRMARGLTSLTEFLKGNMAAFVRWGKLVREIMENVGLIAQDMLKSVLMGLSSLAGSAFGSIRGIADTMVGKVTEVLDAMALLSTSPRKALAAFYGFAKQGALNLVAAVFDGMRGLFTNLAAFIRAGMTVMLQTLATAVREIGSYASEILSLSIEEMRDFNPVGRKARAADRKQRRQSAENRAVRAITDSLGAADDRFARYFAAAKGNADRIAGAFIDPVTAALRDRAAAAGREAAATFSALEAERAARNAARESRPPTFADVRSAAAPFLGLGRKLGELAAPGLARAREMIERAPSGKALTSAAAAVVGGAKDWVTGRPLPTGGAARAARRLPGGGGAMSSIPQFIDALQQKLLENEAARRTADAAEATAKHAGEISVATKRTASILERGVPAILG